MYTSLWCTLSPSAWPGEHPAGRKPEEMPLFALTLPQGPSTKDYDDTQRRKMVPKRQLASPTSTLFPMPKALSLMALVLQGHCQPPPSVPGQPQGD